MIKRLKELDIKRLSIIQYLYILLLLGRAYSVIIKLINGHFGVTVLIDILVIVIILYVLPLDVNKEVFPKIGKSEESE